MLSLVIPSFIAGLLTFFAPCTFPLVPAYLAFIGGSSISDLGDKDKLGKTRVKVFLNGFFFVLGFSFVFILLGLFAGTIGSFVFLSKVWFSRVGGLAVILFGLFMLGVINIPWLNKEKKFNINPNSEKRGTYGFSFFLGTVFGSGWTPCIGPILGSVLVLAGSSNTAFSGALLLSVFSFGLAIPFLLIALGIGRAQKLIDRYVSKIGIINKIGGILVILLGVLLLTDNMYFLVALGYKTLDFFNYDKIINYL